MDVDKWLGSITLYEAAQIWSRFTTYCDPNKLVLWSGIDFEEVEQWAQKHGRKTLTQAMGPLMDKSHPACRIKFKDPCQWSRYVHAASILLALYITTGDQVVVLTPHPPQRLNPYGDSYYQHIEEPWLKACCDATKFKIMFLHPDVEAAQDDSYQYWPVDKVSEWERKHSITSAKSNWPHRSWGGAKFSEYEPQDLQQERNIIIEKLYSYKLGISTYWVVVSPANSRSAPGLLPKRRKKRQRQQQNNKLKKPNQIKIKLTSDFKDPTAKTTNCPRITKQRSQKTGSTSKPTKPTQNLSKPSATPTVVVQNKKSKKKKQSKTQNVSKPSTTPTVVIQNKKSKKKKQSKASINSKVNT